MSDASSFIISELTGPEHKLKLVGRALPYRPLEFDGEMRAEFTYYPGNPQATVQMIGPKEGETTINGMWKDRFMKSMTEGLIPLPVFNPPGKALYDGSQVPDVLTLVKIVDGFRRRGQLLEVNWDELTRRGVMLNFRHKWLRREDVEWEIKFGWVSQDEEIPPVGFGFGSSLLDFINELVNALNDLISLVSDFIDAIKSTIAAFRSIVNLINNIVDSITELVSSMVDLAKQAVNLVLAPIQIARQFVAGYQAIKDTCLGLWDVIGSFPARAAAAAGPEIAGTVTQSEVVDAERRQQAARKAARKLAALAAQRAQEVEAQTTDSNDVARETVHQGQDLRAISNLYYGTPDEWKRLATYNRIKTSSPPAGSVILIPRLVQPRTSLRVTTRG